MAATMEEKDYRRLIDDTLNRIQNAFDDVDPDVVEAGRSGDVLRLEFANGIKCVITPQPPVRQLWVAARASGYHFDWSGDRWVDDKSGEDLESVLSRIVRDEAGLELTL